MRPLDWLLPLCLASFATAQGTPEVPVTVTPLQAPPGIPVVIELTNQTSGSLTVHCDGLYLRVFEGTDCTGAPIRFDPFICLGFYFVFPGASFTDVWDQLDDFGQQAPAGTYSIEVLYQVGPQTFSDCVLVELTSVPQTSTYCAAGSSASNCQASLTTTGVASASAGSGFIVSAGELEGLKNSILFFGANGRQELPWGNGSSSLCVRPPYRRAGVQPGQGALGECDGVFDQDLNALWCPTCPKPALNPAAGDVLQAQLWYRDPQNTSNQSTSLSNAIEFCVLP